MTTGMVIRVKDGVAAGFSRKCRMAAMHFRLDGDASRKKGWKSPRGRFREMLDSPLRFQNYCGIFVGSERTVLGAG